MVQVVKTRVGDDSRLVAELAVVASGQRHEGSAVPSGMLVSVMAAFPVALVCRDGAPCP